MKTLNRLLALILTACLLGGCSYHTFTKTILLPSQETAGTSDTDDNDGGWEVKKIYQYQYSSSNVYNVYKSDISTIGWSSEEDYILYTINTQSDAPQTIINKVDVRYGFYEECANLGELDYRSMKISPDGRYLLYDIMDYENEIMTLYLYSLRDQTTTTIAQLPNHIPDQLMLDFSWSDDSSTFFYWITTVSESYSLEKFVEKEGWEHFYNLCAPYFESADGNMLYQVKSCRADTLEQKVVLNLETEMQDSLGLSAEGNPAYAVEKRITVSTDGRKILVSGGYLYIPFITAADCETGQIQTIDATFFYDSVKSTPEFTQIIGEHIYSHDFYDSSNLFIFTDFSKLPEYTQILAAEKSSSRENYTSQSQITPDESHLLTLELGSAKESRIYISQIQDKDSYQLSGKTLLYQSTDSIYDMRLTPDSRFLILRTILPEDYDYGINSGESDESGDMTTAKFTKGPDHHYKITVLEL